MKKLLILLFLLAPAAAETSLDRAVAIANQEWELFGRQTIGIDGQLTHQGAQENDEGYWQRVGDYWRQGVHLDIDGRNRDEAWSAAFMSWLMRQAGLGPRFHYSEWHAHYIRRSIQARRDGDQSFAFWGYRLSERAPQVGDLVGYARQDDIDYDHQRQVYKSHTDLVVAVRPGEIDVIGGNVSDSVTKKTLRTDAEGKLSDTNHRWFVVMAGRY
ncbi:MAG: DUF2272 domain-containing protein [Vulcanimicrobiota bacterium]